MADEGASGAAFEIGVGQKFLDEIQSKAQIPLPIPASNLHDVAFILGMKVAFAIWSPSPFVAGGL